ncbi:MAG: polysaccharide deacetylase family protein [Nanoarchaeota archaeon]|nr:polysaccharide deacetylase family protein [Nanoarchaeota archaeon]
MSSKSKFVLFFFFFLLVLIYSLFSPYSQIFGKVTHTINTDENVIYLTFDDGPGTETNAILNILKEKNVKATFFVVGERIYKDPETLIRIAQEGHTMGIHSMSHPYLYKNNYYELSETKKLIEELTNTEVKFFRPPYGFRTWQTISTAKSLGLETVTWSSFPLDYIKEKNDILNYVISNLGKGQIICLHDGPTNRQNTLFALSELIDQSRANGYQFEKLK